LHVTPAFLCAAILWPVLQQQQQHAEHEGLPAYQALQKAAQKVISEQVKRIGIPKRFTLPMQEIWELQWQLTRRQGNRAERLLEHARFRAAYDFLLLREQAGEDMQNLGQWWTDYQAADPEQRLRMQQGLNRDENQPRKNNRRRGGRNRTSGAASGQIKTGQD
jgi:poly(A) polymerase